MTILGILDTSMESNNDGDSIIVEAILSKFPELESARRFPTHRRLTQSEENHAAQCDLLLVTGTNILTSNMIRDRQWQLGFREIKAFKGRIVLLGVGWRQYQSRPKFVTKRILNNLLSSRIEVASRDQYTHEMLQSIGIRSINTGCPTTWRLPTQLPRLGDVDECVFTLTDYNPNRNMDTRLLERLGTLYRKINIWPQGDGDLAYIRKIQLPANVHVLERGVDSLNVALEGRDYVGTRLHAGVRAAQRGSAALVIAVDNRGIEIGRDIGFPVVARDGGLRPFDSAYSYYSDNEPTITIPFQSIDQWSMRFRDIIERDSQPSGRNAGRS